MQNFVDKHLIKILIVVSLFFWGSLALWVYHDLHKQSFGQAVPNTPANFETALAIPQATTDTTATLANSYPLPGTVCLTIDSNTSQSEYECGTASTTSPTLIYNLTRGIDTSYGTTSVASNIFPHRTGADVRVTDFPAIQQYANIFNGVQGITNPILYSGVATSTLQTNLNYLASVGYVNSVAVSGAANASLTQNGLVQQATALQLAGGVNSGSTGAILFAPGGVFASSSSATTLVPVTQTNGILNANFIDQTAKYTWSGSAIFTGLATTATTTIVGNLNVNSPTTTFLNLPISFATVASSSQLTTKVYVDNRFSFANSTTTPGLTNSSWTNTTGSTTITSLSVTAPTANRLLVT